MYISVLLLLLTIIAVFLRNWKKSLKNCNNNVDIPGPEVKNNELGNLPDLMKAGDLYHFLSNIHQQFGHVVKFRLGRKEYISTCSPASYKDQMKIFNKPDDAMKFMSPVFGNRCIQFINGEKAKLRRQTYDSFLGQEYIRTYIPTLKQIISGYTVNFEYTKKINIYDDMFYLSCKAVGCTMFGNYFQNDDNVYYFRSLYEKFWPLLERNFTQGLPKEGSTERQEFDGIVRKVKDVVNTLKSDRETAKDRKFIDTVLESENDIASIDGDILSYLVGGFHSTSVSLTWCFYFAGKYQELQDKIHEEIVDVLDDSEELLDEHLVSLRYLKQFINETLRIRFVAPVTNRAAESGTNICGYDIPTGTGIFQALSVTMNDKSIWPDPQRFDPERFNPDNSKGRQPLAFCPFGFAGRRMCPGQKFFYTEALLYLGTLFHNYKFELEHTEMEVPITYGLLTRPSCEIMMAVTRR